MRPAVFLPGKNELVVSGPEKLIVGDDIPEDAARALIRFPDFAARSGRGVGDANRPGLAASHRPERRRFTEGGNANEGDFLTIKRPNRVTVAIHAGVEIAHCLCDRIVDSDKTMIAAGVDGRELATIRRPSERLDATPGLHERRRLFAAQNLHSPNLAIVNVSKTIAFERNGSGVSLGQLTRLLVIEPDNPEQLFRLLRRAARVWAFANVIEVAAAGE